MKGPVSSYRISREAKEPGVLADWLQVVCPRLARQTGQARLNPDNRKPLKEQASAAASEHNNRKQCCQEAAAL